MKTATIMLGLMGMAMSVVANAQPVVRPRPIGPVVPIGPIVVRPVEVEADTNPEQFSQMMPSGVREAFVPFELKDHPVLENGQLSRRGVNAGDILDIPTDTPVRGGRGDVLRPGTKKVRADQYYAELNQMEKFLTDYGYTNRKDYQSETMTIKKLVLKPAELSNFNVQRTETISAHNNNQQVVAAHRQLVQRQTDLVLKPEVRRAAEVESAEQMRVLRVYRPIIIRPGTPVPQPKVFNASRAWSKSWGWSDKFAAYVQTNFNLKGTSDETEATAAGEAGGYVFGKKLRLINGDALAKTPKNGNLQGHAYAYVLGFKIINANYDNSAGHFSNGSQNKNFDESKTIHFTLGPIPMAAKVGGQGNANLDYRFAFLALKANSDIKPGVGAKGYVQAGADIVVAGVGGGANLTIIKDELDAVGRLHLTLQSGKPTYVADLSAYNDLSALNGNMYVYAYIYVPRWGIPPWKKKTWQWDIFNFDGISTQGMIVNFDQQMPLY